VSGESEAPSLQGLERGVVMLVICDRECDGDARVQRD